VPLTRAIGTTIIRELPGSDEPEIWWVGDLFYLPRTPSVGRSWFDGVLVTGDHPPSPVQTVLRGSAYARNDTGVPIDTLHSFVQLEGSMFSPGWSDGVTLHPGIPHHDSNQPGNPWVAIQTGFDDDTGSGYHWTVLLTPGYRCQPPPSLRSTPPAELAAPTSYRVLCP